MKTISAAREAAPRKKSTRRAIRPVKVTIHLPAETFRIFETFAERFRCPLNLLLQSEAYSESECLADSVLDVMEWIAKKTPAGKRIPTDIEFCPEAFLLFSRIAGLLRQSVPELLSGLLIIATGNLEMNTQDGEMEGDFRDCYSTTRRALAFDKAARRDRILTTNAMDAWSLFNLERPARKEKAR